MHTVRGPPENRRRPQATPGRAPSRRHRQKTSASRRRRKKNAFYRCQLTALTYSLTLYCYVFTLYTSLSETPVTPTVECRCQHLTF